METRKQPIKSNTYMVRSYDGMPRVPFIDSFDAESVALKPPGAWFDKPLWFPKEIVFELDEELLDSIEGAYNAGDRPLVKKLWLQAKPWRPGIEK